VLRKVLKDPFTKGCDHRSRSVLRHSRAVRFP